MTFRPLISLFLALVLLAPLACTAPDEQAAPAGSNNATEAAPGTIDTETTTLGEAPDFTLPTLRGDSLRLADLQGDPVLINFWATWCTPCIAEMPDLQDLHEEFGPHGLHVVGISLDQEGAEVVTPFAERLEVTYPLALDPEGSVADAFGDVWALPTTYILDGEGQIVERVIGLFPTEKMRPKLRAMLDLSPRKTG